MEIKTATTTKRGKSGGKEMEESRKDDRDRRRIKIMKT